MKKLLYILLILPFFVNGQGWQQTYGLSLGDGAHSVQQTTDGGYIICGNIRLLSDSLQDAWLIKTDSLGDTLWTNTFGGGYYNLGYSVQQTTDGGYIICGYTYITGKLGEVYLIKTDSLGDSLWTNTFGGAGYEFGYFAQQTTDGGYIITGDTYPNPPSGGMKTYLVKINEFGIEQWYKHFHFGGIQHGGRSVKQTSDGGYIICGWHLVDDYDTDMYMIKTDSLGDTIWTNSYGGSYEEYALSMDITTDGGYIICGYTRDGHSNVYLTKTNGSGTEQWNQTFGTLSGEDEAYSVQQTSDEGFIICGSTESYGNGGFDVWLIKTDSVGVEQWNQTYGGTNRDVGYSVQQTSDGGFIVCGYTQSYGNGNNDVYLIKTDGNGVFTSTFNIPMPNPNRRIESIVDILGKKTKPKSNTPFIEIYDDGTVEKRIIIE